MRSVRALCFDLDDTLRGFLHMRQVATTRQRQVGAALVGCALVVTACQLPLGAPQVPDDVAIPDTIGIIASSQQEDEGRLVTLEDGSRVLLPNDATELTGAGGGWAPSHPRRGCTRRARRWRLVRGSARPPVRLL